MIQRPTRMRSEKTELLRVSFGTSTSMTSRAEDYQGHREDALQKAYPTGRKKSFTAQIIINHAQARDGEKIDNMQQALDRAAANGAVK